MDSTPLKPIVGTHPAYRLLGFYSSLDAYVDGFDPRPTYMVAMPGEKTPPEVWLARAESFARQLPDHYERLMEVTETAKCLVAAGDYKAASRLLDSGIEAAEAQIRAIKR